jgi:hypothetical protein
MDFYAAQECPVALEVRAEAVLRLRPACPLGFTSTHGAVRALLAKAGEAREARVSFGRIVDYPWLSTLLARQAASSRIWEPAEGRARGESPESYVAAVLRNVPEFTALFDRWGIASVSVEKVLVGRAAELSMPAGSPLGPDARLPYDALVTVTLRRQAP